MAFLGLMTVRAHKADVDASAELFLAALFCKDETIGKLQRKNTRLMDELATLEAERERRLAPLIKANEMRREKAAQRKAMAGAVA